MMRNTVAAFLTSAVLSLPALAIAQMPSPAGNPSAGGQPIQGPGRAGADSVLVPDASAQVPTTQPTTGSSPSDDSNSASARGGPGTGVVPGTSTVR